MPTQSSDAMQWLSRTIAIVLIMLIPCYLGSLADRALNTKLWTPLGMGAGMLITITVFLAMANKMIPKGRGRPLSDEEFDGTDEEPPANEPPANQPPANEPPADQPKKERQP